MRELLTIIALLLVATAAHAQRRYIQGSDIQGLGITATGTTNPRSLADRFAQNIYNVKDCGDTGNGTTDDAAGGQARVNLACTSKSNQVQSTVYFPPGTYRITQQLTPWCALDLIGQTQFASAIV